jgi:hypothetical protein
MISASAPTELPRLDYLTPQDCETIAKAMIASMGKSISAPPDLVQKVAAAVETTIRAMVSIGWRVTRP